MIAAAGVLFVDPEDRVLLVRRSQIVTTGIPVTVERCLAAISGRWRGRGG